MHRKGQTAMEYLLLIVIILAVIVFLMMYLQGSSQASREAASCNLNRFLCSEKMCGSDDDCKLAGDTLELCGTYGYCDCMGKCVGSCDSAVTPPSCGPVPGDCGASLNSCTAGVLDDISDNATHYLWNCTGTGGGSTDACSLALVPVNGVCGATLNNCTAGVLKDILDNATHYLWNCTGANGGTTAACKLAMPSGPVNGVCGALENACTAGRLSDLLDNATHYLWNCTGLNGGTTAACKLATGAPEPGVCECDSCESCNTKLAGASCTTVKLITDILDNDGTCISMVSAKTLDCGGHQIDGVDTLDQYGIYLNSVSNAEIKDCKVTDWRYGIYLLSSSDNVLTSNTANNNLIKGIYLYFSSNNVLTSNTANDNSETGINIHTGSNTNALTGNTANNNSFLGFWVDSNSDNTLTGNIACNPKGNADFYMPDDNLGHNNKGSGNTCDKGTNWNDSDAPAGKPCKNTCPTVCECDSCASCTTKLADASCTTVKLTKDIINSGVMTLSSFCIKMWPIHDKIFDCQGHTIDGLDGSSIDGESGIYVRESSNVEIRNCVLTDWGGYAILLSVGSTAIKLTENTMRSNNWALAIYPSDGRPASHTIEGNTMEDNGGGVWIDGVSSTQSLITNNDILKNIGDGIRIKGGVSIQLTNNAICGNGQWDLDWTLGTNPYVTGSGNTCDTLQDIVSNDWHDTDSPLPGQPCKNTCPTVCECDSCDSCNALLSGAACPTIYLDGDISEGIAPGLACIQAQSSKVLDCNGYSITDTLNDGGGTGIEIASKSGFMADGCKITGFQYGIYLRNSNNNAITGNEIYGNSMTAIESSQSSGTLVSGNNLHDNGRRGVTMLGTTFSGNRIVDNRITSNSWDGVRIDHGTDNVISGNTIISNPGSGITLDSYARTVTISGNTVCGNGAGWPGDDIRLMDAVSASGSSNTCDTGENWNDTDAPAGQPCKSTCTGGGPSYCECDSCASCASKLIDASCTTVKLTADITGVGVSCLGIGGSSSDKTFDCQGHIIQGTSYSGSMCVYLSSIHDFTMQNCKISNCDYALNLQKGTTKTTIRNSEFRNNLRYGIAFNADDGDIGENTIANNIMDNNGQAGLVFSNSDKNTITSNTITNNHYGVFLLHIARENTFSGNTICGNSDGDIYESGGWNQYTSSNTCTTDTYNQPIASPYWHDSGASGTRCKNTCP